MDNDWSEHYIKRGDPTKPTYYIIRRQDPLVGLLSNFMVFAGHIRYALSNGWLPVVDMQNYPNAYLAPEKLGKENSWEYYFEQPLRIRLEVAYAGENVILSDGGANLPRPDTARMAFFENRDNVLTEWRMLVKMGLLKVKPALLQEILFVRQKLFASKDRVLGVHLRGTDYVAKRPLGHTIPPPIEFAISTVIMKINEWQCNKIFLATEDKSIMQVFKNIFRDFCVTFDKAFLDYKPDEYVSTQRIDRPNDHFLQGKEYMTEMVLLSTCNSFVGAQCNGTFYAVLAADKFEHIYIFNLGRYGVIGLD